ncbi:MAG: trypsin-like peptidase domain-containing protein [Planctomycetales bacterium]|nr:trypsin-like peptidase domain-containing protein [Planctomycetales bacterium]
MTCSIPHPLLKRLAFIWGLAALLPTAAVHAQAVAEQVFVPSRVIRSEAIDSERDQAYQEIAEEYSAISRQVNLLKKVVRLVRPAVVHLESVKVDATHLTRQRGDRAAQPTVEEAGSGVVIQMGSSKYILTNRHVVRDAKLTDVTIRLEDGQLLQATRILSDSDTDVAVIEVAASHSLVDARVGNSDDLEIGDFVLAVGSPFGLSHSVSYGIVSAKGRRDLELGDDYVRLQDFLQTDTAINPGNSGGPLLNLKGEVVGINTAIASNSGGNEGVSFAVPINLAMFVARQLIEKGEVNHAYLGVQLDSEFNLPKAHALGMNLVRGALVKGITPQSPAYYANLQVNDVVLSYDDTEVEDDDHLVNLVSITPIQKSVSVEVLRNREKLRVQVRVGNRQRFESRTP